MSIANRYQENIGKYRTISEDENEHIAVREYSKDETGYQIENLKDLLESVRSYNDPFSNALILKYFEGYTLDEAAIVCGMVNTTLKNKHAELISYLKHYKEGPPNSEKIDVKSLSEAIKEHLYPKYKMVCKNCEKEVEIPSSMVEKIIKRERRREKALARVSRYSKQSTK